MKKPSDEINATEWVEDLELYTCPCCGEKTVFEDICADCWIEDEELANYKREDKL